MCIVHALALCFVYTVGIYIWNKSISSSSSNCIQNERYDEPLEQALRGVYDGRLVN